MPEAPTEDVSQLLRAWSGGDHSALDRLTPLVYHELHRIAQGYMARERADHTLQATSLVNEAYLRLVDYKHTCWQDRAHFFAVSAQAMRRILVDHARRQNLKRGGGLQRVSFDQAQLAAGGSEDFVSLDDALDDLAKIDPRKAQVVELRFFGGLTVEETAEVMKLSAITVLRDWVTAKAWLFRALTDGAVP